MKINIVESNELLIFVVIDTIDDSKTHERKSSVIIGK
jgi:hypothetical protein